MAILDEYLGMMKEVPKEEPTPESSDKKIPIEVKGTTQDFFVTSEDRPILLYRDGAGGGAYSSRSAIAEPHYPRFVSNNEMSSVISVAASWSSARFEVDSAGAIITRNSSGEEVVRIDREGISISGRTIISYNGDMIR